MAKERDMSLLNDVLEPFRRAINTDSPKDKLSTGRKLNFSDSNQSVKDDLTNLTSLGKRKFSIGTNDFSSTGKRSRQNSDSKTTLSSPWEARKMRTDLIEAKAQIRNLESRIEHQHMICKEMQVLHDQEKLSLVEQHKRDEKSLAEMEERMQVIRRRESELKEEFNMAMKEHKDSKIKWDKEKLELSKQLRVLEDKLFEANASSKDQISEMKKDMNELLQALESAQKEVETLKKENEKQTALAKQYSSVSNELATQTLELEQVTRKLKELEYERDSYKDWQQQVKTAERRLSNMEELEKEVARLRATEHSLRDAISNKLLLEEQVHFLNERVEAMKPLRQELHECKLKLARAESSLEEWNAVAQAHKVSGARALAAALDAALGSQLTAVATCAHTQSQLAQLSEELATLKYERDKATSALADMQTVRKNHESLIHRLQKRLLLITRERDSYRQQLDCYEKELTVTISGESGAGNESLLAARIEQLEKFLQGYRDLVDSLDQEAHTKLVESLRAEVTRLRDEAAAARREAGELRAQRDRLQAQLERLDFHQPATKVVHLKDNPAAAAQKQIQVDLDAAQEEIKRLKALLRDGTSRPVSDDSQLRQQLENSRKKLQRMKEEFTSSAQEYRDVCYMLLGYKIDRTGHRNYRISNMYAESPEEYLTFTLCDDGIEMVHTEYSTTLEDLVDLHLHQHHSIPMFLSALTMDLFTRTTMQQHIEESD